MLKVVEDRVYFIRKRFGASVVSAREMSLQSLKRRLRKPSSSDLLRQERRLSEHQYESDKAWRGSVIDLSRWASEGDGPVFSDASDNASDVATHSAADSSYSTEPQNVEDTQDQADILGNASLNLCHRCAGMDIESLSSDHGYEHGLLSELPSRDQLVHPYDWANSASTGLCKLCLVFMSTFEWKDISGFKQDRHRLRVGLEGLKKEEMHDQDHFQPFRVMSDQRVRRKQTSVSRLVIGLMDLDNPVQKADYLYPGFDASSQNFRMSRYTRRLGCYTDIDDPSVPFGVVPVRQVGNSTSSTASFEVAAAWLSQCLAAALPETTDLFLKRVKFLKDYSEWKDDEFEMEFDKASASAKIFPSSGPERPIRLLEIGSGAESGMVRLTENNKDDVAYAALSYCWGRRPQIGQCEWLTTIANVHSRRAGMQRSDLPQTLQDSITVAERLGIKHVWIDSLCIIQDSDDDWAVEAAKMGEVYRGSVVTIVAANSNSAEHGCFNQRSTSTMQSLRARGELITIQTSFSDGRASKLHITTLLPHKCPVSPGLDENIVNLYKGQVKNGPWINRAWTLQEQIFSRRILFYTDKMLLWECDHCRMSEDRYPQTSGDSLYPLDLLGSGACRGLGSSSEITAAPDGGAGAFLTADTWYCGLVEDYTRRDMTFSRDKMVAIGALAKATSLGRRITYLAGLWGDSFRYGLMWRRDGPGFKIAKSTCPSWSWASQSSPVSYGLLNSWPGSGTAAPQILDVHVEPADKENPFGDVQSGYVLLRTKVQMGRVLPDFLGLSSPSNPNNPVDTRGLFVGSETVISQWPVTAFMDDEDVKYDQVLIAVVGTCAKLGPIALLLHPPRLDADEYRRVGLAILEFGYWSDDEVQRTFEEPLDNDIIQWATRTIKIV